MVGPVAARVDGSITVRVKSTVSSPRLARMVVVPGVLVLGV